MPGQNASTPWKKTPDRSRPSTANMSLTSIGLESTLSPAPLPVTSWREASLKQEETARFAAENGYDSFSTTLLISPYQNYELIIKTAQAMAKKYHVTFLYRDFRPYFKEGQEKARAMGLYMQKYCGCVFSEEDRFLDRKKGLVTIQKYNNRKEEDAGHKTGGGKDDGDQDSRKEKSL